MYIAMNHFRVQPEKADAFEQVWRERESFLADVPGFRAFHLLRGPLEEGSQLFASHTTWESEAAFRAWTESEAFRRAHAQGGGTTGMIQGPPRFVGWQVVL